MTNPAREHLRSFLIGAGIAVVMMIGLVRFHDGALLRRDGLLVDSLEASRDTTRRVTLALNVLANGTQLLQRRAVQTEQHGDSLDHALKLERKMRAEIRGTIQSLSLQSVPAVASDSAVTKSDTLHLRWAMRHPPYTIGAYVTIPPQPTRAVMDITIDHDPVQLGFRIHCGPKNEQGIRPAMLDATTPDWFKLDLQVVEQDPSLCNPLSHSWRSSWFSFAGLRDRLGVFVGAQPVFSTTGLRAAPTIAAGIRVWP